MVGVLLKHNKKASFTHIKDNEGLRINPGGSAPSVRLELTTVGLEVRCAVQLRYEGINHFYSIVKHNEIITQEIERIMELPIFTEPA